MSLGTLYIMNVAPRSNWMGGYIKELNLDINVKDMQDNGDYATIFPLHKAPGFIGTDGFKLTEVIAIVLYFSQLAGSHLTGVTAKDKLLVVQWLSFINDDFRGPLADILFVVKTEEEKKAKLEKIATYLNYIENHLSSNAFLVGDSYTAPDIYGVHVVNHISKLCDIKQFPNIVRWSNAVESASEASKFIRAAGILDLH